MEVLYTAEATATGGRKNGHAWSSDGAIDVQINPPKEVGGSGEGTNPEQLFAAGYAACFDNALASVARIEKLDAGQTSVTALVALAKHPEGGYALDVELLDLRADLLLELVLVADLFFGFRGCHRYWFEPSLFSSHFEKNCNFLLAVRCIIAERQQFPKV